MRLSEQQISAIKKAFEATFKTGDLYLFGSRIDDGARGGDIDLFVEPSSRLGAEIALRKKIDFLLAIKSGIGEQKVDVVIDTGEGKQIEVEARNTGVKL